MRSMVVAQAGEISRGCTRINAALRPGLIRVAPRLSAANCALLSLLIEPLSEVLIRDVLIVPLFLSSVYLLHQ